MNTVTDLPKLEFNTDVEKNWLINNLKNEKVNITFQKVDGTIREMLCTLNPELLPKIEPVVLTEGKETEQVKPRKESTTAFRVYDLEKSDWRSVCWSSIISIVLL